jgi:hypothetical protein
MIQKYMLPLTTVMTLILIFRIYTNGWLKTSFKRTLINLNICLLDHPITVRIK